MQVVSSLVSEIILCVKEVNRRTRIAAFELLIGLAHAMDEQYPAPLPTLDAGMGAPSFYLSFSLFEQSSSFERGRFHCTSGQSLTKACEARGMCRHQCMNSQPFLASQAHVHSKSRPWHTGCVMH